MVSEAALETGGGSDAHLVAINLETGDGKWLGEAHEGGGAFVHNSGDLGR